MHRPHDDNAEARGKQIRERAKWRLPSSTKALLWPVFVGFAVVAVAAPMLVGCKNIITQTDIRRASDRTGPSIKITSPADGSYYAPTVTVKGTVTDNASASSTDTVSTLNYQILGTSVSGMLPFSKDGSFSLALSTGGYSGVITIELVATDWNNNRGTAAITLKDYHSVVPPAPGNLAVDTSDSSRLRVTWSSVPGAQAYHLFRSTEQNAGYNSIYDGAATVFDDVYQGADPTGTLPSDKTTFYYKVSASNYAGLGSQSGSVSAYFDHERPTVAIATIDSVTASETETVYSSNTSPAVAGTASSNTGVQKVEISLNGGTSWSTATTSNGWANWSFAPGSSLAEGAYPLEAKVTDVNGYTNVTLPYRLVVDTTDPTVSISAPTAGQYVGTSTPTATGSASDVNGIATVEVSVDGGAYVDTGQTTSWSTTLSSLADGTHSITARATDPAGNTAAAGPVTFSVDTTAPTITMTTPVDGSVYPSGSLPVQGTAYDANGISAVHLALDGSTQSVSGLASWSTSLSGIASWDHTICAYATDKAGHDSAASCVGITVLGTVRNVVAGGTKDELQMLIQWTAAPTSGVMYNVYRNGTLIAGSVGGTSYIDSGTAYRTTYQYQVSAAKVDARTGKPAEGPLSAGVTGYRDGAYSWVNDYGSTALKTPTGITIDAGGSAYVTDSLGVYRFDPTTGKILSNIGTGAGGAQQFVAQNPGHYVFVTDPPKFYVDDYDVLASSWSVVAVMDFFKTMSGILYEPKSGFLFVSDSGLGQLFKLAVPPQSSGTVVGNLSVSQPRGMDYYNGTLWVADQSSGRVLETDANLSPVSNTVALSDHTINAVAHDADGYMIVTKTGGFYVVDPSGKIVQTYTDRGTGGGGQIENASALAYYNGELFFALPSSNRISVFALK